MTKRSRRIVMLHGANLDMLGERALEHYGTITLQELEKLVCLEAAKYGWGCRCLHTNHEGEYIEFLHKHRDEAALLVNPGAWTHYSYAIRDALEIVKCPVAEVHLSDVASRDEWRRHSVISPVVTFTVTGRGPGGYQEAVRRLVEIADTQEAVKNPARASRV
jgi:3-dehydroquinate dehydratase-2